jgi:hypothetical protein
MTWRKLKALAASAHIETPVLTTVLVPWMKKGGFIDGATVNDTDTVECNVLDYNAILKATAELFHLFGPTAEECAVLGIVQLGIQFPQLRSDLFSHSELGDEPTVKTALELANSYRIVRTLKGDGIAEPVTYSPLIWGTNISKISRAVSHLDRNRRDVLIALVDMIRQYQGLPFEQAQTWVKQSGAADIVDFAVGLHLLDRTVIVTATGENRVFLTTPHLYGEVAAAHGKDVCDRVRLFLDSIRHGQHYGKWYTGKITSPGRLLEKLLSTGEIGPCTAIGKDYQLVEKAGVVNVRPSPTKPGQFTMHLVQDDTVRTVKDVIAQETAGFTGVVTPSTGVFGQESFVSAEAMRAQLGEPPQKVREAEEEILKDLREM